MTFLHRFPDELSSHLVTHWLSFSELNRMDTALCSKQDRKTFLSLVKNNCVFPKISAKYASNLIYLDVREIRTNHLNLDVRGESDVGHFAVHVIKWLRRFGREHFKTLTVQNLRDEFWMEYIAKAAKSVQSVHLIACKISIRVMSMINAGLCTELNLELDELANIYLNDGLHKLRIKGLNSKAGCKLVGKLQQLTNLRSLELHSCLFLDKILLEFSLYCPNVVHVNYHSINADTLAEIMHNHRNLQSLHLTINYDCTNHLLDVIAERHGHSLQALSITNCRREDRELLDLQRLIETCVHLHTLYLTGNAHQFHLGPRLPHITTLSMECHTEDVPKMRCLATQFPNLQVLGMEVDNDSDLIIAMEAVLMMPSYSPADDDYILQLKKVYVGKLVSPFLLRLLRHYRPEVQFLSQDYPTFDVMAYA